MNRIKIWDSNNEMELIFDLVLKAENWKLFLAEEGV